MSVTIFSPAKINLFLAVTGRRADGFHDLVSVAAPLDFGDELRADVSGPGDASSGVFSLECDDPAVPVDGSNLILKAAEAFALATGWPARRSVAAHRGPAHPPGASVRFKLTKRIPMGAGLGGGSSNAVAALRALNQLAGGVASDALLETIASALGSDCALFLKNAPVVLRGRGERVEALADAAARRVRGQRVLLFKPGFGVSTAWAYSRMAALAGAAGPQPSVYRPEADAEKRLAAWCASAAPAGELLFNNLEGVVFGKFVALPVLLEKLRNGSGVAVQMSGSGSACFALPGDDQVTAALEVSIREAWGPAAIVQRARIA